MFSHFECCHRGDGMGVIGGGDHHRIDVLVLFFKHLPEIGVFFCLRVVFEGASGSFRIDVAECYDVLVADRPDIRGPFTATTDAGDVEFFAGSYVFGPPRT